MSIADDVRHWLIGGGFGHALADEIHKEIRFLETEHAEMVELLRKHDADDLLARIAARAATPPEPAQSGKDEPK